MAKKHEDPQRGIICRRDDRHHFRMFESLVGNEGFINLTRPAREAYLLMGLASKGRLEFSFPQTAYIRYMSKPTFISAKRELIAGGFIEEKRYGYLTVKYRLSNEWLNKKNAVYRVHTCGRQSGKGLTT